MGGLVSALEAQNPGGLIDGALTTCGLVAGGVNLLDYQLDGEYAVSHLLSPQPIQLVQATCNGSAAQRFPFRRPNMPHRFSPALSETASLVSSSGS